MFSRKLYSINLVPQLISVSYKTIQVSCTRHSHTKPQITKPKPLPRLIYLANPLKHCWAKFNMKMLKMTWDPKFSEEEFNKGACRVRPFLHQSQSNALNKI